MVGYGKDYFYSICMYILPLYLWSKCEFEKILYIRAYNDKCYIQSNTSDMLSLDSSDKARRFMEVIIAIYEAENGYEKIKALNKMY